MARLSDIWAVGVLAALLGTAGLVRTARGLAFETLEFSPPNRGAVSITITAGKESVLVSGLSIAKSISAKAKRDSIKTAVQTQANSKGTSGDSTTSMITASQLLLLPTRLL